MFGSFKNKGGDDDEIKKEGFKKKTSKDPLPKKKKDEVPSSESSDDESFQKLENKSKKTKKSPDVEPDDHFPVYEYDVEIFGKKGKILYTKMDNTLFFLEASIAPFLGNKKPLNAVRNEEYARMIALAALHGRKRKFFSISGLHEYGNRLGASHIVEIGEHRKPISEIIKEITSIDFEKDYKSNPKKAIDIIPGKPVSQEKRKTSNDKGSSKKFRFEGSLDLSLLKDYKEAVNAAANIDNEKFRQEIMEIATKYLNQKNQKE